jgi:hypothetical protein
MKAILEKFDLIGEQSGVGVGAWLAGEGETLEDRSPIDNQVIGRILCAAKSNYETVIHSLAVHARRANGSPHVRAVASVGPDRGGNGL